MDHTYDIIIVGAGAMGSAAAYHLAKSGRRVLLLEQFEIDHQYGSSHGQSRIIRYSYDHDIYVRLARNTYPMWRNLEAEADETLHLKTGGLDFGAADDPRLLETIRTVQRAGIPHELLSPREAEARFPHFRFADDFTILYQPDSGVLKASNCVLAHLRVAQRYGADVLANTPVTGFTIHTDSVEVRTDHALYRAGALIITAGGWARQLLAATGLNLPLQVMRCQEVYFQPTGPGVNPAAYDASRMPVYIYHTSAYGPFLLYGLPSVDKSGVKTGFHGGPTYQHPEQIDYTPDTGEVIDQIRSATRRYLPAIGDGPLLKARACLYTMTPDEHFIIDTHPAYPHVAVGSPCSGHGFKFSTLIGKILGDLVTQGSTDQDISLFGVQRFL